jgi:hypothetical protein
MNALQTNDDLDKLVISFDARQGERMIEAVHRFLVRFVSYPSEHACTAHALWIVHTHLMAIWDSTPRLAFLSAEPASGKSRALEVSELLVPNAVATVNVTPAYLFRKIANQDGATILFDEIDTVFGPKAKDNEDIRGLLNAGHRRGATTGRCVVRGNQVFTEELPAYAAVALAGLGWLPDTLLSRSVIIRMRRRHAGEPVEPFRRRIHEVEGWRIRDQITTWAQSATVNWPRLPDGIVDRDADVWEPLIAVADAIGGVWPGRARDAGVTLVTQSKEVEPSLGIRLLNDIRTVFGDANETFSKPLLSALHAIDEAPWSDIKGKPLDERGLANRLRQYGVKSKTIRIGNTTLKGYSRADLVDLWARYLPPSPVTSVTSVTSVTTLADQHGEVRVAAKYSEIPESESHDVTDVTDVTHFGGNGRICAHCDHGGGQFCEVSVAGEPLWLHVECKDAYRP